MKNNKTLGILAAMSAIIAGFSNITDTRRNYNHIDNDLKNKSIFTEEQKKTKDGLKKFIFSGVEIYAINQKNAYRKAKKLGLI